MCNEQPAVGLQMAERSRSNLLLADGYIIPDWNHPNFIKAAEIIEGWIQGEDPSSINHQPKGWVIEQWKIGHGALVVFGDKEGRPLKNLFDEKLNEEEIRGVIAGAAFIKKSGDYEFHEEVELGTLISNPHHRRVGAGKASYEAVHDLACSLYPNARKVTWVKNGSRYALFSAFGEKNIQPYDIEIGKYEILISSCVPLKDQPESGCKGFDSCIRRCCHEPFMLPPQTIGTRRQTVI